MKFESIKKNINQLFTTHNNDILVRVLDITRHVQIEDRSLTDVLMDIY